MSLEASSREMADIKIRLARAHLLLSTWTATHTPLVPVAELTPNAERPKCRCRLCMETAALLAQDEDRRL